TFGLAVQAHTASDAPDRDSPRLCHTSAADRLSYGGGDGHRCRSAAQSGQVSYGRMTSQRHLCISPWCVQASNLIRFERDVRYVSNMNQIDRNAGISSPAAPVPPP